MDWKALFKPHESGPESAPVLGPNHAIRELFCANCQEVRQQVFLVVGPELVAACKCGRLLKWPLTMTKEELAVAFEAHAKINRGQLPAVYGASGVTQERSPLMDAVEALPQGAAQ